jgi:hypothetical protein
MKNKVQLDGKIYPFAITYNTMIALEENHGIEDIAEAFASNSKGKFKKILSIVYEGIITGCKREGVKFDLSFDAFKEIDIRQSDLVGINSAIINCMIPDESPNAKAPKVKN